MSFFPNNGATPARPSETPAAECPTCGNTFMGKFCHNCGEKRVTAKDFDISQFAHTLFEYVTRLDSKVLRTFKLLFTQPGQLSANHIAGRRAQYLKPLQTFLLLNLFFFLLFSQSDIFSPKLEYVYNDDNHLLNGISIKAWVDGYAVQEGMDIETAKSILNARMGGLSKGLLYLFVPVLTLCFWVLFYRQNPLFLCHFIFAIHWFSFFLLFIMIVGIGIFFALRVKGLVLLLLLFAALLPFHLAATRRFYGGKWWVLTFKSIVFLALFGATYLFYREFVALVAYLVS
jgi:hypothetical protein